MNKLYRGAYSGRYYLWNGNHWLVLVGDYWSRSGYGEDYPKGLSGMMELIANNFRLK